MVAMRPPDDPRARALAALDALPTDTPTLDLACATLRALLTHGARPAVAAVGRRGAGKSTLLNALANRGVAEVGAVADTTLRPAVRALDAMVWLDTPGLRAGGRTRRAASVAEAVRAFQPDVLWFLCGASEVDAGIDDDLRDLRTSLDGCPPWTRLVAVVTRVDELAPPDVNTPPFDADPEKRANLIAATTTLHRHLLRGGFALERVIPLCADARWEGDRCRDDVRWNLAPLARPIVAPTQRSVTASLQSRLAALCDALVARAVDEARTVSLRAPSDRQRALLEGLHRTLVARLDALLAAFVGDGAATLGATVGDTFGPGRAGELVRSVFDRLGAREMAADAAAARVRALGRAVRALESLRPDEALVRAMLAPRR